ncbi:hypothetical protein [Pseudaminobacter salicylatoxidans]|uniref:hypothetical protein n=1 Tax=Pseudaminobacter salicylatoxidans TaxID=93369 RepID=UPI0012F6DE56|nr:hypothetical protein [Pseudaminobacter salicylatoxidans]
MGTVFMGIKYDHARGVRGKLVYRLSPLVQRAVISKSVQKHTTTWGGIPFLLPIFSTRPETAVSVVRRFQYLCAYPFDLLPQRLQFHALGRRNLFCDLFLSRAESFLLQKLRIRLQLAAIFCARRITYGRQQAKTSKRTYNNPTRALPQNSAGRALG